MHLSSDAKAELSRIAKQVAVPGKGILACDESAGTAGKRFEDVGVANTEEHRRVYREILFTMPTLNQHVSAVILDPETLLQSHKDGLSFPDFLVANGIVPGIKPHLKVTPLPGHPGETIMQGLDSLGARCAEYYKHGARFAKWRSPMAITATGPSDLCIDINMRDLARYALICQEHGLVPIVEPDISMDGDHDLLTAVAVNVKVQSVMYRALAFYGVYLEGTLLKPNMVNPGKSYKGPKTYTADDIGRATVEVLRQTVPAAVPGVNFLSGGQSFAEAAARLNGINKAKGNSPWNLSFSFSRAIQIGILELWRGKAAPPIAAMHALLKNEVETLTKAALGELAGAADGPATKRART